MKKKIRSQPRIKGIVRVPRGTSTTPAMDRWVRREADLYGVSLAFVVANCISFASRIPMESYRSQPRRKQSNVWQFIKRRA